MSKKKKKYEGRGKETIFRYADEVAHMPRSPISSMRMFFDPGYEQPPTEQPPPLDLGTDEGGILEAMENQIDSNDYMLCVVKSITEQYENVRRDFKKLLDARKRDMSNLKGITQDRDRAEKEYERHKELLDEIVCTLFGEGVTLSHQQIITGMMNLKTRRTKKNERIANLQEENERVNGILEDIAEACEQSGIWMADHDYHINEAVDALCKAYEGLKEKDNCAVCEPIVSNSELQKALNKANAKASKPSSRRSEGSNEQSS